MSDFSQDIQNFQRYGAYIYQFDNVGNMILNGSSSNFNQVYVSFPLQNVVYNLNKINTVYNTDFEEFVPPLKPKTTPSADNLQEQLDVFKQENDVLKTHLDSLIAQTETSGSVADQLATKQVIIELRKQIGPGRVDSDFSDTFPYTYIRK